MLQTFISRHNSSFFSDKLMFFSSSRRRHTSFDCDWSSDVCSSDLLMDSRNAVSTSRQRCTSPGRMAITGTIWPLMVTRRLEHDQVLRYCACVQSDGLEGEGKDGKRVV